jgi:hypothetical protein
MTSQAAPRSHLFLSCCPIPPKQQFERQACTNPKLTSGSFNGNVQKTELLTLCPASAALLPPVTPFPQVNVLSDTGITGRHLKYCTVPDSALTGPCTRNVCTKHACTANWLSPTYLRGQQWVSNVGPLRTATVQQCQSQARAAAVGSATPSTTNCNGPTATGGCGTAKRCRSVRTAILCVVCSTT